MTAALSTEWFSNYVLLRDSASQIILPKQAQPWLIKDFRGFQILSFFKDFFSGAGTQERDTTCNRKL